MTILTTACTRAKLASREEAMRPAWTTPTLSDDLPLGTLIDGLRSHAAYLKSRGDTLLVFGKKTITSSDYALALDYVLATAEKHPDRQFIHQIFENEFEFQVPYGSRSWGTVLMTSYYEPFIKGARQPTPLYPEPLLATPPDLIEVALGRTDDRFSDLGQIRGRLASQRTPRGTPQILPYFTREEIARGALKNRRLELAWVDRIDAFFIQIQGSGIVSFDDETILRVGYSDQNGHPYAAIGKFLKDFIPIEKMTQGALENHLRSIDAKASQEILNRNPSYVFFQKREGPPLTAAGTPVIAGRTIATDARYFPKGVVAYLTFEKPEFASPTELGPAGWKKTARLVFDQDTGGAIRGGGRLDLFWGTGDEAKQHAGVIKQEGSLYYLLPKPELIQRLKAGAAPIPKPASLEERPVSPPREYGPQQ